MTTQSGFADVNGTRLYHEIAGSGQALVFLHGFSLDRRMWDAQFETFAAHYRTVRYDQRGFGRSSPPTDEPYSHVEDLKALMDLLEIDRAHVVGQSRGGRVAVDFALTYPNAVDKLVLVDSALGGYEWSKEWSEHVKQVWGLGRKGDIEEAKEVWLNFALFKPALADTRLGKRLRQMVSDYFGWQWANRDPELRLEPPAVERLGEIQTPVLVIVGEYDLPDFHAIGDTLATDIRGAKKTVLPGAGHMSNMEAPRVFNEAVLGHLEQS